MVFIELFGMHRDTAKIDRIHMPLTGTTLVSDALAYLKNKYPALTLDKNSILVTVNHEMAPMDRLLKSNDVVFILPHIGGG